MSLKDLDPMEMLKDIETILAMRTVEGLWQHYVDRLAGLGFLHVAYHRLRILDVGGAPLADGHLFLSSYTPRLVQEILAQDGLSDLPMHRWICTHRGSESWDWMHNQRRAGRLSPAEERMLDLFARYGHVSGHAISLGDSVPQMRAGVTLSGAIGMRQDRLDALWRQHRALVMTLTGLVHLRLSVLPYAPPENALTLRQREVLEHIAIGRTTQEIAGLLDLTPATVEKHLRLARRALGARTTAQAVLLAASRRQILLDSGDGAAERGPSAPTQDEASALSVSVSGKVPDACLPTREL